MLTNIKTSMEAFKIKSKKIIKHSKYGYYKCPNNVNLIFSGYSYYKDGEHLLYTAILQYISNIFNFKKCEVSSYKNGNIFVYYDVDSKTAARIEYNINDFYFDGVNNILYYFQNSNEKISFNRKLKIEKIKNKLN